MFNNNFNDIEFTDDTTGYAVGGLGSLVKTTDGGETWTTRNTGITDIYTSLNKIQMINSDTGYAVGGKGAIIKTTDAGETWTSQVSGITSTIYGLHFPEDELTGWVSGATGKLLKTTDGGQNWTPQAVGVSGSYMGLHFINNLEGYIVNGNKFHQTTDGGATWTYTLIDPSATTITPTTFYCQDEQTFFVLTTNGKIYKTENAGIEWTELIYVMFGLYGIETTPESIIAVGNGGIMIKSNDGGSNWTLENSETHVNLKAIHIKNDSTMWVCGEKGAILHLGGMKPLSITILSVGSYCAGTDGSPIGLENSEIGVVYTLLKDGVAQLPAITGTGSAVSFGNQLEGTYKVSAENQYGTTIFQDDVSIIEIPTVGSAGMITGNETVCTETSNSVYSVEPINEASDYIWTLPYGFSILNGENTNEITVSVASDAVSGQITVQGSNECGISNSQTLELFVLLPTTADFTADNTTIFVNETIILIDASENNTSVQWTIIPAGGVAFVGGTDATSQNPQVTFTYPGLYDVELFVTGLCGDNSVLKNNYITVNILDGISETSKGNISVYPNPASTFISIETKTIELNSLIEIISPNGQVVYNGLLDTPTRKEINIENLNSGIYVIKITNRRSSKFVKFLVQ